MIGKILIGCLLMLNSCGTQKEQVVEQVEVNESIEKLGELINLPIIPLKSRWILIKKGERRKDGSGDYHLICVLSYKPNQIDELNKEQEEDNSGKYLDEDFVREWFPQSVRNEFYRDGDYIRIKPKTYNALDFAKNSFLNGYYFITKDNEVFLFMYTT